MLTDGACVQPKDQRTLDNALTLNHRSRPLERRGSKVESADIRRRAVKLHLGAHPRPWLTAHGYLSPTVMLSAPVPAQGQVRLWSAVVLEPL